LQRKHQTVAYVQHAWARAADGDGVHERQVKTIEGLWTSVRNFLQPFRGVHKRYLGAYISICEFSINLNKVKPRFISSLVALP
jgi:transposase